MNSRIATSEANKLFGKQIAVFGDSIWARDRGTYPTGTQYNTEYEGCTIKAFPTLIRYKYNAVVENYAVSGDTILKQMPVILSKDYSNTDIVVIAVGVNDYSASEPLGSYPTACGQSFDDKTFIGAYCKCIEHIKTQNPKTKIILCTPLQRDTRYRNNGTPDFALTATDIYTQNEQTLVLNDYRKAIINIAELYSCIVADMYAESGINYLTMPTFTADGVHPIDTGYEYASKVIFVALEKAVFDEGLMRYFY
jgi:lysophospholipase L1-like esterase